MNTFKIGMVYQTQYADCGYACLSMITQYFGDGVSLQSLRSTYGSSDRGLVIDSIIEIASDIGLNCVPLRLDIHHLINIEAPLILHWQFEHYVVAVRASKAGLTVHDPTCGVVRLDWSEVNEKFTGVALSFSLRGKAEPSAMREKKLGFRDLLSAYPNAIKDLAVVIFFALIVQLGVLLNPIYIQLIVDKAIASLDVVLVAQLTLVFILFALGQTAMYFVLQVRLKSLSRKIEQSLVGSVFWKLLTLPLTYFQSRDSNSIFLRFDSLTNLRQKLSEELPSAVLAVSLASAALVFIAVISIMSAMILLASCLALAGVMIYIAPRARQVMSKAIYHDLAQKSFMMESIFAIETLLLNGSATVRESNWQKKYLDFVEFKTEEDRFDAIKSSAVQGFQRVCQIFLVGSAVLLVFDQSISIGVFFSVVFAGQYFIENVVKLSDIAFKFYLARAHLNRLEDIVLEPSIENAGVDDNVENIHELEVKNLSFSYPLSKRRVLEGISFRLNRGESLAITGSTGCGKSTLIKCVLNVLDGFEGEVLFDGVDVRSLSMRNISKLVGAVMQSDIIFKASISENITMFSRDVDEEWLNKVVELACLDSLIKELPMGLHAPMGERGNLFSGGECQRVLIARALYKKPSLLIFDESTSNLDVATEISVNENIRKLNVTKLIIAHRPDTINSADHIYDMESRTLRRPGTPQP